MGVCVMFQCFPKCFDVISAQSFDISVGYYGSRVVADHTVTVSGTCPFRKESAFKVRIDQSFLHLLIHGRIHQVQEREQTAERIPEAGIRKHIPRQHFSVVRAVVYDLSFGVYFIKTAWEQHRTIEAGIESAQIVDIIVFHIYFAHFTVPDVFSFSDQLVETILAQFFEIQFRLLITDKRRSDTCVNDLPFLGSESDDRSGMVALNFCFVRENVVLFHAGSKGKRFVELDDEIILEVLRHSAAVLGRITDDLVFFRNHLHIRAFVECVDNDISVLGFRIRETEHNGTLRRNEFRSNVVVCEIYLIIIRFGNLRLVREPAGTLVLVEYQSACDRHDGKLTVVVHPRAGLMCLFEAPDFVGIVGICPTVAHFTGLRCPEVHSPRQCRSRIGISGR